MTSPTAPPFSMGRHTGIFRRTVVRPHPPICINHTPPRRGTVFSRHWETGKRCSGGVSQSGKHPTAVTSSDTNQFFRPQDPPSSLRPVTECVLQLPPVAGNQQWGHVLEKQRLVGYVALPLPLVSRVPAPGALTKVTLVRGGFNYTNLRAQWSS